MGRLLTLAFAFAAGAAALFLLQREHRKAPPDPPALIERIREVARLEALDVTLYKKVSFAPDPSPQPTAWGDLAQWVHYSVRPPHGKAIVFARAHLGYDLQKLDAASVRVEGDGVRVLLPAVDCQVELLPGETEIVDSTLDSAQTAELLQKAKSGFEREALGDSRLRERAERSAQSAIRALLLDLGFRTVAFGEAGRG